MREAISPTSPRVLHVVTKHGSGAPLLLLQTPASIHNQWMCGLFSTKLNNVDSSGSLFFPLIFIVSLSFYDYY
jgi:hypothetical protein